MDQNQNWPQLVHLESERIFPLRVGGATTFGRAPRFFNYQDQGIGRWQSDDVERLKATHYVSLSDDTLVSRTHGIITHSKATGQLVYQDLNSANGSTVNFQAVVDSPDSRRLAEEFNLPPHFATFALNPGDVLAIGGENFGIELVDDPIYELQQRRTALLLEGLAGHADQRFAELETLLIERGFSAKRILKDEIRSNSTADNYDNAVARLVEPGFIHSEGATLLVITCQVRNRKIVVNGEVVDLAANFYRFFDKLPGAKVIVLVTPDDATDFHNTLFAQGFRDTVLISDSTLLKPPSPLDNSAIQSASHKPTLPLKEVLSLLFDPTTPILQIDELGKYRDHGLEITIGQHEREVGSYGGIIQSLDLDLGSSFSSSLNRM